MSTTKHSAEKIAPCLVFADESGNIYDHPDLLMLCRRGSELTLPRPDELMPLPVDSEFFLLPGRGALGLDPETGQVEELEELAVAVFASPAHTLSASAAYQTRPGAPTLPLFAYGAVGFYQGQFYVCARRVDQDRRQEFASIPRERIETGARKLLAELPQNRLVRHLTSCALTYGCPAAKNLALGRFEAPLPTSRTCNARCVGCISYQPEDSGFPSTQNRIGFKPTDKEIIEVMRRHQGKERRPIYSFGQGCEGEPLTEAGLIASAVSRFRKAGGKGTVNINTNASLPGTLPELATAGVNSIRVSLNSVRKGPYEAYYRPNGYRFEDVLESIRAAKALGLFVSLNLLYFPGVTDCENEWDALNTLVRETQLDFIQLRNLNLDPELAMKLMAGFDFGPCMGLANFMKRLKKANPHLGFGYFNPYLEPGGAPGS
jgi:wyosine [tRNA(Phe)-imidazoG37] synthetase (radical SAM superfamily)